MPDVIFLNLIDAQLLAAGFLGGLIHAFRDEKATPWQVMKYIVTGGVAANFLAPEVLHILAAVPAGFIGFGIGLSGKHLCLVLEKIFDKLDVLGRTKNE